MNSINSTCHGIPDCLQCTSSKCFWVQISATKTNFCIEAIKRGVNRTGPIPTGAVFFPSPLSCRHQNEVYTPYAYNQNRIGLIVGGVVILVALIGCFYGILCLRRKWIRSRVPRARSNGVRLNAFRASSTVQVPTSPRVQPQPMKPSVVTPTGAAAAVVKGQTDRSPQGNTFFVAKINDGGKAVQSVTVTRAQRFETSVQYTYGGK